MEKTNYGRDLARVFKEWKITDSELATSGLYNEILFARANGIDLVLKIPITVLKKPFTSKPIWTDDAVRFLTNMDDNDFIFEIPSDLNQNHKDINKNFRLKVMNYRGQNTVLISNPVVGSFGFFRHDEISSIEVK